MKVGKDSISGGSGTDAQYLLIASECAPTVKRAHVAEAGNAKTKGWSAHYWAKKGGIKKGGGGP